MTVIVFGADAAEENGNVTKERQSTELAMVGQRPKIHLTTVVRDGTWKPNQQGEKSFRFYNEINHRFRIRQSHVD